MAGYGLKDAARALRERKDAKPEVLDCQQCEDTGFVIYNGALRQCPLCLEREIGAAFYETHTEHVGE